MVTNWRSRLSHEARAGRDGGFTIVELIVVMAILATLIAMIAPALSSARKRAAKTAELSNLKQVGHAWMLYANSNEDAALPGYLAERVQRDPVRGVSNGWGVKYKFPDTSVIPLNATNLTGPWTWRLLSYLDFNHALIHAHLNETRPDTFTLVSEAQTVAYEPAFGYNGMYIGGSWDMEVIGGIQTPRYKFNDQCNAAPPRRPLTIPMGVGQIARPADMITFCSARRYLNMGTQTPPLSNASGWFMVTPPTMAQMPQWQPSPGDPARLLETLTPNAAAPIGRYTGGIAVLRADGSVGEQGFNAVFDQRMWINSADTADYRHSPCGSP